MYNTCRHLVELKLILCVTYTGLLLSLYIQIFQFWDFCAFTPCSIVSDATLNILLFAKKLEELHAVTYEEHLNFSVIAFERQRRRV